MYYNLSLLKPIAILLNRDGTQFPLSLPRTEPLGDIQSLTTCQHQFEIYQKMF